MAPRSYRSERRQAAAEETRARILQAARALLADPQGIAAFTIDAVARKAEVARMTVYYQFQSKPGLLEALFDDMAESTLAKRLPLAFMQPDARSAMQAFVRAFCDFYDTYRIELRRVRALKDLDPELITSLSARDERRRHGWQVLLRRLGVPETSEGPFLDERLDLLLVLTSFETFDDLRTEERGAEAIATLLLRMIEPLTTG
jgi:AcrR family transcriptional regulator